MSEPKRVQRFSRNEREYTHDLFKLKVSNMKRNVSYKWRSPKIQDAEHCHFFHSINDTTFQPNKRCSPVGNHFHEVIESGVDSEGRPMVKFGPPMRMVNKTLPNGEVVRYAEPVTWEAYGAKGEVVHITDEHSHDVEYLGSENFSPKGRMEFRRDEREKVASATVGQPIAQQAGAMGHLENQSGSDVARAVLREENSPRPPGQE